VKTQATPDQVMPLQGFWSAVGFLTRLPIPPTPYNDEIVRASMRWYPLVGALIGVLVASAFLLAYHLFPGLPLLIGVMTLTFWVGLTGALHLDGLADTIDGWVGGLGDRERTLAIMKDPHVGSSAVVWLCLFLMAKVAVISSLLAVSHTFATLLFACVWGRLAPLWLFQITPYVRAKGLASAMQNATSTPQLVAMTLAVFVASLLLLPLTSAVIGFAAVVALFFALRGWMLHRLGGCTGDTTGALIELTELFFLLTVLAVNA
jgi:adenosylcobinamide-GDP ribazoletransferase